MTELLRTVMRDILLCTCPYVRECSEGLEGCLLINRDADPDGRRIDFAHTGDVVLLINSELIMFMGTLWYVWSEDVTTKTEEVQL